MIVSSGRLLPGIFARKLRLSASVAVTGKFALKRTFFISTGAKSARRACALNAARSSPALLKISFAAALASQPCRSNRSFGFSRTTS